MSHKFFFPVLLLLSFTACSSSALLFDWNSTSIFAAENLNKSKALIDKYETKELYFTLKSPERSIRLHIEGSAPSGLITGGTRKVQVFYTIDREIKTASGSSFVEIGRNYDRSWECKEDLLLVNNTSLPFMRLIPDIYRIRFISFDKEPFELIIKAEADHPLTFSQNIPVTAKE